MASCKEYLDFILEQLGGLDSIGYRSMMGEYIIYYKEKIAAYICDDRLLVKPVPTACTLLPDAPEESPYEGAKEMLLVEDTDDAEFLRALFRSIYDELPKVKKNNKK